MEETIKPTPATQAESAGPIPQSLQSEPVAINHAESSAAASASQSSQAESAPLSEQAPADAPSDKETKKKKYAKNSKDTKGKAYGVLGSKTLEDVIKREAKEEQDSTKPFSLSNLTGATIITRILQRQVGLVLLICAFFIIHINNRYICQKKQVEIENTTRKLVQTRYKATVCRSVLTEQTRESNIIKMLEARGDSTLTIPNEPPYLIRVKE